MNTGSALAAGNQHKWQRTAASIVGRAASAALLVGFLFGCGSPSLPSGPRGDVLAVGDVTLDNAEEFVEEMRQSLPPGSTRQEVEAYLVAANIQHRFFDGGVGTPFENSFHVWIDNIGQVTLPPGIVSPVRLEIEIFLGPDERLDRIESLLVPTNVI